MDPLNESKDQIKREDFAYRRSWIESCTPMEDFLKNKVVLAVIIVLFIVLSLIFICCSCIFCRYRQMKYQYYSKVKLLGSRSGANGNTGEGSRDETSEKSDSGRTAPSQNLNNKNPKGKRQIIYKIGDDDE